MKPAWGELQRNSWVSGILAVLHYTSALKGKHGIKVIHRFTLSPASFFCAVVTLNTATLTMLQSHTGLQTEVTQNNSLPTWLFTVSLGCTWYKLPFSRIWKVVYLNFCIRILSCRSIHISVINLHTLFKGTERQINHCHMTDSMQPLSQ